MKKKLFSIAVCMICLAVLGYGTHAFFTAEDTAHNIITTGGVDISIEEFQQSGDDLIPYPNKEVKVMPGTAVSKVAAVKNHEAESFVRARFQVIFYDSNDKEMTLSPETLASLVSITMSGDDWVRKSGDGLWWYYNVPLGTGDSTEPLFTEVAFSGPNMTNEYQNCTVKVIVHAEAVQAKNNEATAVTADGWPNSN